MGNKDPKRIVDITAADRFQFGGTPLPSFIVYIVRCGDFVKVGTTQDLRARLQALQAANPYPITLLATLDGDDRRERELHRRLAPHRHRNEWFRLEGDVTAFIAELVKDATDG
jgi:hypothetical protein